MKYTLKIYTVGGREYRNRVETDDDIYHYVRDCQKKQYWEFDHFTTNTGAWHCKVSIHCEKIDAIEIDDDVIW